MKREENSPLGLYMLGTAALFLAGFLLLVVLGAQSYRMTTAGQLQNNRTRSLLAYLSAMVRANDAEDAVYIADGPGPGESAVLVIEDGSGYAARIYRYDGYLVEDYGETKADYAPDTAMKIGPTQYFALGWFPEQGALRVDTDEGSVLLALRSRGGVSDFRSFGEYVEYGEEAVGAEGGAGGE